MITTYNLFTSIRVKIEVAHTWCVLLTVIIIIKVGIRITKYFCLCETFLTVRIKCFTIKWMKQTSIFWCSLKTITILKILTSIIPFTINIWYTSKLICNHWAFYFLAWIIYPIAFISLIACRLRCKIITWAFIIRTIII